MVGLQDILACLPHAPPFRFLSHLVALEPGTTGRAEWEVRGDEDFFRGHFPSDPLVPGVLLLEAMAQLSGLVGIQNGLAGRLVHSDVRFDAPVRPPARIVLDSTLERTFGSLRQFEVKAAVGTVRVARGSLTLAQTGPAPLVGGDA